MYIRNFSRFSLIYKTQELQNILMFVFEIGYICCCCCCRWFQQKLSFKFCSLYSAGLFQLPKIVKTKSDLLMLFSFWLNIQHLSCKYNLVERKHCYFLGNESFKWVLHMCTQISQNWLFFFFCFKDNIFWLFLLRKNICFPWDFVFCLLKQQIEKCIYRFWN